METIKLKDSPYVRLAHSDLIEGEERTNKHGETQTHYKTAFLLPKNVKALESIPGVTDAMAQKIVDMADKYKAKVTAAAEKEKPKGAKLDNLFKDGDVEADNAIEQFKEEHPGKDVPGYLANKRNFWVCNAGTNYELKFFGPKGGENLGKEWAENNIYDGCWVRLETRGYSWSFKDGNMTKKGFSLGLSGSLQKWQDAERFSSGGSDEEVEETLEINAPKAEADDFID